MKVLAWAGPSMLVTLATVFVVGGGKLLVAAAAEAEVELATEPMVL
jgi:hypothetical protein